MQSLSRPRPAAIRLPPGAVPQYLLGDTLGAHAGGGHGRHGSRGGEPPVGRVEGGGEAEGGRVLGERGPDLLLVAGMAVQHAIVSDEAVAALGQKHLVPELDRVPGLAALDEIGVGSKSEKSFACTRTGSS